MRDRKRIEREMREERQKEREREGRERERNRGREREKGEGRVDRLKEERWRQVETALRWMGFWSGESRWHTLRMKSLRESASARGSDPSPDAGPRNICLLIKPLCSARQHGITVRLDRRQLWLKPVVRLHHRQPFVFFP